MLVKFNPYKCCNLPATRLLALLVCLLAAACKQQANTGYAFLQKTFQKIETDLAVKNRVLTEADINTIDAAFAAVSNPEPEDKGRRYFLKAQFFCAYHDYDKGVICCDSGINVLKNHLQNKASADLFINLSFYKGELNTYLQKYDEAVLAYSATKMAMKANAAETINNLHRYYSYMANIFYAQKKFEKAAFFFKKNGAIIPFCSKDSFKVLGLQLGNLGNIAESYGKASMADSASHYFNATLDYLNAHKKRYPNAPASIFNTIEGVVYGNFAEVLYQQNKLKQAEAFYLKSNTIFQSMDDPSYLRYLRNSLAGLYLQTGRPQKAGEILTLLGRTIDSTEVSAAARQYYKLLSDYYYKTSQLPAANQALLHSFLVMDSIEKRDRHFNATDIALSFENNEQINSNELLRKDNELKKGYQQVSAAVAGLVFVVAMLVGFNLKRKRRYVKKLSLLNTELKQQNNDLHKTLDSLEQSHAENKRIVRTIAHDLKSPISAIRTLVHSMSKKEQDLAARESLDLIETTCLESISLIKILLSQKADESGIQKELIDIGRLIEQCIELFQSKASEKKQQLKLEVDHPVVMLNRQNIWRVVSNIVNNAIKFSPENSDISIKLERKELHVLLSVHDKGIGIPQHLKDKIFSMSEEKSRTGTAGEASYGMGLSISQQIIEEHHGRLWFESEAGNGCAFYVELPYHSN